MMKKLTMICALACAVLAFSSCKSSESAYKKAYEKAKAQEAQNATPAVEEAPVVTPLETKPAAEAMVENATVRQENVELIDGAGLQTYSVIVGSFQLKANAEGLQSTLKLDVERQFTRKELKSSSAEPKQSMEKNQRL